MRDKTEIQLIHSAKRDDPGDDYGNPHTGGGTDEDEYEGFQRDEFLKEHSSTLGKILTIIIVYFLITLVIDPMTADVDESGIIYDFGSYPYHKIRDLFRDDPLDTDGDGIPDHREREGWQIESEVLVLTAHKTADFDFVISYPGRYRVDMNVLTDGTANVLWGWGIPEHSSEITAPHWRVVTLNPGTDQKPAGLHRLKLEVTGGNLTIDRIWMTDPGITHGRSLYGTDTVRTNGTRTNMEVRFTTDPLNPDTDHDGMLDGYETATGVAFGGWQDPLVTNHRFALLIAGGSTNPEENFPSIRNSVEYAYGALHDFYGYRNDHITVLSWDGQPRTRDVVDAPATLEEIGKAFDDLAVRMGPNDLLFVYIVSHGLPGSVEVYNSPEKHDLLHYSWVMENLTAIRSSGAARRIVVVVEACHSGSSLFDIRGEEMVVVASTAPEDDAYAFFGSYALFSYFFFHALQHPNLAFLPSYTRIRNLDLTFEDRTFISVGEAFRIAKDSLKIHGIAQNLQVPQMDQDGDGIPDTRESGMAYMTHI